VSADLVHYAGKVTGTKPYRLKRQQPLIHVCAVFSFTASDNLQCGFNVQELRIYQTLSDSELYADTSDMWDKENCVT
jgi:hypothetical protein